MASFSNKIVFCTLAVVVLACLPAQCQDATTTSVSTAIVGGAGRQNVRMVASVSTSNGSVTSGQVTFILNGKPLKNAQVVGEHAAGNFVKGTATIALPLPAGPYSLVAHYSGTSTWRASTSSTAALVVPSLAEARLSIQSSNTSNEPYSYLLTSMSDPGSLSEPLNLLDLSTGLLVSSADLTSSEAQAQTVQHTDRVGFPATSFITADLSGNGTNDLAVCNSSEGSVSIYMEESDGSHVLTQSIPVGTQPTALVAADLNGDGLEDLAVVNTGDGTVSVILQDPSHPGKFLSAISEQVGSMPVAIAAGDFNQDGIPDLAVANFADDTISILLGNPNSPGTFSAGPVVNTQNGPSAIAIGDLMRQGHSDMIVANYLDGTIAVFGAEPGTEGLFGAPKFVNRVGNGPTSISIGDLNGDGLIDVVTSNTVDGTISILPAIASTPGAYPTQYIVSGFCQPTSVAMMWSAQSNVPDLAVADGSNGSITILKNDGFARFLERSVYVVGAGLTSIQAPSVAASPESYSLLAIDPSLERVDGLSSKWSLTGNFPNGSPLAASVSHKLQASYSVVPYGNLDSNIIRIASKPKQSQSIQFSPLPASVYGAGPITLSATASSKLPVEFSIKSGKAELSGDLLTIQAAGIISVQADQPGDVNYSAAPPVIRTIYIARAPLTVTANSALRMYGAANPSFSGQIVGLVPRDTIDASYSSAASPNTPAGVYASLPYGIIATVAESPMSLDYDIKTAIGSLTICPIESASRSEEAATNSIGRCPASMGSAGEPNHLPRPVANPTETPAKTITTQNGNPTTPILISSTSKPAPTSSVPVVVSVTLPTPPIQQSTDSTQQTSPVAVITKPIKSPVPVITKPSTPQQPSSKPVKAPKHGHTLVIPIPIIIPIFGIPRPPLPRLAPPLPHVIVTADSRKATTSLALLTDKRRPAYYGWVAVAIALDCSTSGDTDEPVTLTDGNAAIGTLKLKPGKELDTYVHLSPPVASALAVHFWGDQQCEAATSQTLTVPSIPTSLVDVVGSASKTTIAPVVLPEFPLDLGAIPSTANGEPKGGHVDDEDPIPDSSQVHDKEDSY